MTESEAAKARRAAHRKKVRMERAKAEGRTYVEKPGKVGGGRAARVQSWTPGSPIVVPEHDPL